MTKPLRHVESRVKDPDELLGNWAKLNEVIMNLNELEVQGLIEHERSNKARIRVMLRLYNRFSKLRSQREKRELAKDAQA